VGSIARTFEQYPKTGPLLPAMGYSEEQIKELEATINATPCDTVIAATPIDLTRVLHNLKHPMERVRYELQEIGRPTLVDVLGEWLGK
jgi:predicted GTPase